MERDLLAGLSDEHRQVILARMSRRSLRKGDTLFHEGDVGDSLHLVRSGKVAVRTSTPSGDVVTLAIVGPGSTFGELALIRDDNRRTASIVALEPTETAVLHRRDFEELRSTVPAVERILVELLASRTGRLTAMLVDALYAPAELRVIRHLADLADLYSTSPDRPVDVPIRQEDIASMAGTTRPTANRVLKQLADEGLVTLARGRTVVTDHAALRRRAG